MADFRRGIKAGIITGIVYIVISAILGEIHYNFPAILLHFPPGTELTLFTWRDLTDPSIVHFLLSELFSKYILRGIIFGAVFAALYNFLPSVSSIVKGMVLSLFLCILAIVETIYTTPGWPTDGYAWTLYGTTLHLSSISLALAGIISTVVFGALTGFLWDGFRAKRLTEESKGSAVLLVSFIFGLLTWVYFAITFIMGVVIGGGSPIQPEFWWFDMLATSVVFLGLPGWILARVAWRKTKVEKSGLKWGVAGGVLMALTGIMIFPGVLAIIGGVLKERKPANELSTAANVGRLNCYMPRVSIFLIAVAFLITVAVIAGMVVGSGPPSQNLEIRTWYDLDAVRDNLRGHHILMNDLDATTAGYTELASETANQGKGWQPIGYGYWDGQQWVEGFEGTFDGQGYEISDLFINRPDEDRVGLFGAVEEGGVIENATVVNADVTGKGGVGGLVGINMGTMSDSYSTGSVTGNSTVGGLVGQNWGGTVHNSYSSGSVIGEGMVGGLVGGSAGTVSNSYSTGSVTGNIFVGGLVGWYFDGTVSDSYSTSSVSGNSSVGGLVASNHGTVSNSYSTGSVTGNSSVGGLVGQNGNTVSNSYSTGSVTGNSSVGGLVGQNVYGTVSDSFWDTETSGQATLDGGTGKTTAEMQDIATFSGAAWDIIAVALSQTDPSHIWNIVDDIAYPFLSWQS